MVEHNFTFCQKITLIMEEFCYHEEDRGRIYIAK